MFPNDIPIRWIILILVIICYVIYTINTDSLQDHDGHDSHKGVNIEKIKFGFSGIEENFIFIHPKSG